MSILIQRMCDALAHLHSTAGPLPDGFYTEVQPMVDRFLLDIENAPAENKRATCERFYRRYRKVLQEWHARTTGSNGAEGSADPGSARDLPSLEDPERPSHYWLWPDDMG
jgi:hypothetical protein